MVGDPPAVAPQPGGDMLGGVIEGRMRIAGLALTAHGNAAPGMHIDITGKKTSGLAERHMRFQRLVKIFMGDDVQISRHVNAQGVG
jgi:hypothetical protein